MEVFVGWTVRCIPQGYHLVLHVLHVPVFWTPLTVKGVTTRTSYEYELWVSENKVQLMRIRDENGKFRSNSVSILNVTFA